MLSELWKSALKIVLGGPQKNLLKSLKNMNLSGFFSYFWGLNYPSYQLFEATFK